MSAYISRAKFEATRRVDPFEDTDQLAFAFPQEEIERRISQFEEYSLTRLSLDHHGAVQTTKGTQTTQGKSNREFPAPAPIKNAPFVRKSEGSFFAIQEWEGYVSELTDNAIRAELWDLEKMELKPSLTVEIPLAEISETTLDNIRIGSVFRWSIGYYRSRAGQKDRISRITFRRLQRWSVAELDAARREADELAAVFNEVE